MEEVNKKKTSKPKTKVYKEEVNTVVKEEKASNPVVKEIDQHQYITVLNGFEGTLVYQSTKTGELFVWDSFGDEQEMELLELRNARNSQKSFFINNWFMFGDEFKWVIDYLGMSQYYNSAIDIDEFDNLFDKNPDEVAEIISSMSVGQKNSLCYKARKMIVDGKIDSNKMISTIEKALGVDLVERS